jgi:hypothetical protein
MDEESELRRAKWLIFGIVIFLVSGFFSYRELVYAISGKETRGEITKTYLTEERRRGGTTTVRTVEYSFTEANGTQRTGTDTVSTTWPVPADRRISIRYTPGADGNSRLSGQANWIALVLFGISAIVVIVFFVKLMIEATQATRELNRGPRRRKKKKRYSPPRDY